MTKAMPSALALESWKVKSVVNPRTSTWVEQKALPASLVPPSVNCKRLSSSLVLPLNCIHPGLLKPKPKLMGVVPLGLMLYTPATIPLSERPEDAASARMVVVAATEIGCGVHRGAVRWGSNHR